MASPSEFDYDWTTNPLGLRDYERDTPRKHSLVLLFVEGRTTEFPVYITLSAPYMSYLQIEGEDPAGCYFGIYTRLGDWLDNELIAQGINHPTTVRGGWNAEFAVFELLLNKNEIIYSCDGDREDCWDIELTSVKQVEDRFKQCSGCKMICYCSQKCQAGNWKYHKKECALMLAQDIRQIERLRSKESDEVHIAEGGEMEEFEGGTKLFTFPQGKGPFN